MGRLVLECPLVANYGRMVGEHPLRENLGRLAEECPLVAIFGRTEREPLCVDNLGRLAHWWPNGADWCGSLPWWSVSPIVIFGHVK